MTAADIENVIAGQAALIAALDAGDVVGIETTTASLSRLLASAKGGETGSGVIPGRVDHALKQADAARTRVNYLADRTRQRIDRLAERRGLARPATYTATGRYAL